MPNEINTNILEQIDSEIDEYMHCTGCLPDRITLNTDNLRDLTATLLDKDSSLMYDGEKVTHFVTYRGLDLYVQHGLCENNGILID